MPEFLPLLLGLPVAVPLAGCPDGDDDDTSDDDATQEDDADAVDDDATGDDDDSAAADVDGDGVPAGEDGVDTFTFDDLLLFATDDTVFGDLTTTHLDYKSQAHHDIGFVDLLFVHAPSAVTAEYEGTSDGSLDIGSFIATFPSPNCNYSFTGNGFELTGGTLPSSGALCDTDLYFNLGDHDINVATCEDFGGSFNNGTYGPVWSWNNNDGCPFDDPSSAGLGHSFPCLQCASNASGIEGDANGFGHPLGLNTGTGGSGENYIQMYVR